MNPHGVDSEKYCRRTNGFTYKVLNLYTYNNHDILHVLKLLRVEEGGELLSVCCQVSIQIGPFESPLIPRKHLLEVELVGGFLELLRVGWWKESNRYFTPR